MNMEPEFRNIGEASTVGRLLRQTRNTHGQTIEGISQLLRIRKIYLEAIENDDYDVLPGGPYGLGFVKSYAEHLGLDGKEILRRYREESNAPAAKTDLTFPKPVQESRVPGGAILLIAALLAVGAYGGWYYMSSQGKTIADLVQPLPGNMQDIAASSDSTGAVAPNAERTLENAAEAHAAEVKPDETSKGDEATAQPDMASNDGAATDGVTPPAAQPQKKVFDTPTAPATMDTADNAPAATPAPAAQTPGDDATNEVAEAPAADAATGDAAQSNSKIPLPPRAPGMPTNTNPSQVATTKITTSGGGTTEVASIPAAPEVGDAGGGRVFGAVNADSRVTITATETSWVRIREDNGNILLTRMLSPGDIYKVPNRDGLKLEVGNAGALEISVDGKKMMPVGDYGAVISDYSLNPDDVLAAADTKPKANN